VKNITEEYVYTLEQLRNDVNSEIIGGQWFLNGDNWTYINGNLSLHIKNLSKKSSPVLEMRFKTPDYVEGDLVMWTLIDERVEERGEEWDQLRIAEFPTVDFDPEVHAMDKWDIVADFGYKRPAFVAEFKLEEFLLLWEWDRLFWGDGSMIYALQDSLGDVMAENGFFFLIVCYAFDYFDYTILNKTPGIVSK
jgi:hypothetical protein